MEPNLKIIKFLCHISGYVNVKNHAYWQKLFKSKLRFQETPGTISRSATLRRDKKRSELRHAHMAGPTDGDGALRDVQENEQADQHGVPPDPSDLAARTKTAESKNKRKNRKRGGKASATSNSSELQVDRAAPKDWKSTRSFPNKESKISSISGKEMTKGAPKEPLDPPVHWALDTCLWDFVVEQGLSGREPHQEIVALKEEISTKTGPNSPLMRDFWAALSFGMTVFSCQDGIHLGWRRRPGLDGGLGGSSWTVEQVRELRARLWACQTDFRERLGIEVTSFKAETLCMETGIKLMYRNLGPDCWDLILA